MRSKIPKISLLLAQMAISSRVPRASGEKIIKTHHFIISFRFNEPSASPCDPVCYGTSPCNIPITSKLIAHLAARLLRINVCMRIYIATTKSNGIMDSTCVRNARNTRGLSDCQSMLTCLHA